MKPKISIIIPVYNAEKYLRECLDTVLAQSFTDFEVLIINDGSTDSSRQICDEYAQKDGRFKVIHKENGGVSSARNVGLDNAKGEWITFVDSDDVLKPDFFISLLNETMDNADFILSSINRLRKNKSTILFQYKINELLTLKEFLLCYNMYQFFAGPWGKLFKNKVIQDAGLYFNKDFSWGEDALFNLQYLNFCNHVQTLTYAGYDYREVNDGLSKKKLNYSYELNLASEIKNILIEISKTHSVPYKSIQHHLNFLSMRVIVSIYNSNLTGNERIAKIDFVLKNFPNVVKVFESQNLKSKILGLFLRYKFYRLFDAIFLKLNIKHV